MPWKPARFSSESRRRKPKGMLTAEINRVKDLWGDGEEWSLGRGLHFTEHPAVQERINWKVSGHPHKNPYEFLFQFLAGRGKPLPVRRCLTLGCGTGALERGLATCNFSLRYDACDIADSAIARARRAAMEAGLTNVHYDVADVNAIRLEANTYDVVFGVMSVHHLSSLEHVFREVRRSLRDGGVFFLNEFVGPTKFQWTDRQLSVINGLLQVLPERYRTTREGIVKQAVVRPTIDEMNRLDPSEAIRSGEILDVLSSFFRVVEKKDFGGTILHMLMEGIAFNFRSDRSEDMRMLQLLFDLEDALLMSGDIPSDFTVIIAER